MTRGAAENIAESKTDIAEPKIDIAATFCKMQTNTTIQDTSLATNKYKGCLVGLACGDALGTTNEFKPPSAVIKITTMQGGGPFKLKPGQWTDDTSMALCLADSLVTRKKMDAQDQLNKYAQWYHTGFMSSTGKCFDIGNTIRTALGKFSSSGRMQTVCGDTNRKKAGNGSLMRLAPVPMFFAHASAQELAKACKMQSETTHAAPQCIDACIYYGMLIQGALLGYNKEQLLAPMFCIDAMYWQKNKLDAEIATVAMGSYKNKEPPQIVASGYVVASMEAALWAFYKTNDFASGCLLTANLGNDSDTVAAIYGMLAGAYYGFDQIPIEWRTKLHKCDMIVQYAIQLQACATMSNV